MAAACSQALIAGKELLGQADRAQRQAHTPFFGRQKQNGDH